LAMPSNGWNVIQFIDPHRHSPSTDVAIWNHRRSTSNRTADLRIRATMQHVNSFMPQWRSKSHSRRPFSSNQHSDLDAVTI
jgi:hypothetical protein